MVVPEQESQSQFVTTITNATTYIHYYLIKYGIQCPETLSPYLDKAKPTASLPTS